MPASEDYLWFKSSHSAGDDRCVEVAVPSNRTVLVRDSKAGAASPILRFPATEWRAFLTAVRGNEFDTDHSH